MKRALFFLLLFSAFSAQSQSQFADSLVKAAMAKMKATPAYECDITIDLDVKFINIEQRKGKVYFTPPDSIRYKIKGFAFLPKKGYNNHAYSVTQEAYVALHLGSEDIAGFPCEIVKVIPNDIESDVVLGQFWIDKKSRIRQMTIVTKDEGKYNLSLSYGDTKYPVPSKVVINFDVKEAKLPGHLTGDLEAEEIDPEELKKSKKGSITIMYSNYMFK